MARIISCTAPHHKTWRLLVLGTLLIGLLLAQPLVARADNGDKGHFTATASIFIASGGTGFVADGNRFRTEDELIAGCIVSSTWTAIRADAGCPFAAPSLMVFHSSLTTIAPNGHIAGMGEGTFVLGSFQGRYRGPISAQFIGPTTIGWIQDRGTWDASDGNGNTAKGTFDLQMQWEPALGTLVGTLTLDGTFRSSD